MRCEELLPISNILDEHSCWYLLIDIRNDIQEITKNAKTHMRGTVNMRNKVRLGLVYSQHMHTIWKLMSNLCVLFE